MTVRLEIDQNVAWLHLDRPPLNLFDTGLQLAVERALHEVGARSGIRAVVFTGSHGHFSAGGDVREMATLTDEGAAEYAARISRLTREVAAIAMPVVAAVQGYALGGGCELALAADFRICTPTARFGLPETPLGLIPGAGGTQRLPHLIGGSRAKDIVFSGRQVDAEEATRIGLVDQVVPTAELHTAVMRWLARYTAHPAAAVAAAKQAIDASVETSLAQGLDFEHDLFAPLLAAGERTRHFQSFQRASAPVPS
ncbi:enoyl-CoA hydratase/isomerase family protein [Streptomyces europaeiscabiei]|uniref:enoyl-CoA hydratase/isomerase family protein n=1 Tax=Streptomyces TaxID=1883 RepID=UPI000A38EAC7|nr:MULTISPECIES: enoyl-CoA hydratase/isomerase family protein [Streptomyces]MDX3584933.1 enoyl-CoA hydratase/isomerase family protein [Streptomyces europaeiscabiei]MDX3619097.1 enoyl-CoA hydratase/isomerase family protein [Streptomyces europaeiscabiei]MDX3635219.1 enoyl-CoA hydratase/isomerase family protein [Streptomyces europaeiscabiei]MDX3650203.1 enoyl-CoA hydratase/isomerase family protein [Streptomyces europaeiscabiei]WUD37781.1 enoyl-CoA hydratase/isomerase family protein [Streptomyces 